MGPVAWSEAGKVPGLHIIDSQNGLVSIEANADSRSVVDGLIAQYGNLFGQAGREVCREAVSSLVGDFDPSDIPNSLK